MIMRRYVPLVLVFVSYIFNSSAQIFETSQGNEEPAKAPMQAIPERDELNTTITSDRFDLALEKGQGTFIGNVKIKHPDYTIEAKAVDIEFEPNRPEMIRRFIARGNVLWKTKDREGSCAVLDYDWLHGKITFRARAIAKEKQRTLYGDLFVWDQKKNRFESIGRSRVEFHPQKAD